MTNIYFFIQHYPKWITGGHKYHCRVYEYALATGYPVKVFGNSRIEDKYYKNKIIRIWYGLLNTFRIPEKNVILMTNASFLDYIIPIYVNKLFKRHKYFFIIHHLVQAEKPESWSRKFLENAFVKAADYHVAVSNTTKKQLKKLNLITDDIAVVPPGIDKKKTRIENKSAIKFRLLYVGTIERRKGLLDLIRALKYLSNYDFVLNVIGLTKEEEYFRIIYETTRETGLEKKVNFHGRVSDEKLEECFRNSSLFVFPSYWEGYGMVVAEAMSYGLPVVISNIPVFRELVTEGKEGYFFELNNPENLAEVLKNIFDNKVLLEKLSLNAFEKSKEFLTYNEMSQKIMAEVDFFIKKNKDFFLN